MKTHKNIDRLFQEKLKDFEASPPKEAWDTIKKEIDSSNKKPLFPLWLKIGTAATILVLLTITGINYFNSKPNNKIDTIVTSEEGTIKTTSPEEILIENSNTENSQNITDENLITNVQTQKKNIQKKKTSIPVNPKKIKIYSENSNKISSSNTKLIEDKNKNKKNSTYVVNTTRKPQLSHSNNSIIATATNKDKKTEREKINSKENTTDVVKHTINRSNHSVVVTDNKEKKVIEEKTSTKKVDSDSNEEDIAEVLKNQNEDSIEKLDDNLEEETKEETKEESVKKWSVATIAGPVFFNSFSAKNSLIDESFIANGNQISNSLSAGIKVGYKLNKKLSLQSGIHVINVSSQTNDVYARTTINPSYLGAVNYAPLAQLLNISATPPSNDVVLARSEVSTNGSYTFEGVLNQEFGYIEVPIEAKYNFTEGKKIGLNLVGGFSTLFLSKNAIHYESEGFTAKIGEANNLNNINFSGNIGIDVDYNINNQLNFNLSPMLKIQTNTFSSNSGNFKPYVIGVYTGLNYKF